MTLRLAYQLLKTTCLLGLIATSGQSLAVDTDNDGLPDDWETANGRDPLVADYMVSAGGRHTCALDDTGVVCWGYNEHGQTTVPTLTDPTQVSAGGDHTCALLALRYLFGLRGDALIAGVIASDATRTTSAEIEVHIGSLTPVF